MYIENTNKAILPTSNINSTQFNQYKESFHDAFHRTLNSRSNSRLPKIELTGILIPCNHTQNGTNYRFKLGTDSKEYFLNLNEAPSKIAKKMEWEEVTVKGYLNLGSLIFEVEKISLSEKLKPIEMSSQVGDSFFELDFFKNRIAKLGGLDIISQDYAS